MDQIVQMLKALGDETRLKILIILSRRKICAKGISKHLGISEAAVSQHLKILKEAGIVIGEKLGYFVKYDIKESSLLEIIKFIEQINDQKNLWDYSFDMDIPNDCKAACKSNQNRCCHKNKQGLKGE